MVADIRKYINGLVAHWISEGDSAPRRELIRDAFINLRWMLTQKRPVDYDMWQ